VYPASSCSITTEVQCEEVLGGVWTLGITDCSGGCPTLPANDACPNATVITANALYTGSTNFASRDLDSVPMNCETSCGGQCNSANDVWFEWVNNDPAFGGPVTDVTFSMCDGQAPLFRYDSMMVIYKNVGDPVNLSGCPTGGGVPVLGGCCDDCCFGASGPSRVALGGSNPAEPFVRYFIRISGWQGTNGQFTLKVFNCGPGSGPCP
jgi:hypothetical protein